MEVERIETSDGHFVYRLHSAYDGDAITVEPGELLMLMRWLRLNEADVELDADFNDELKLGRKDEQAE
jgi:hypothetical protein